MWFNRHLQKKLKTVINSRPVTLLTGARQTGKSSLLRRMFPARTYVNFDNILEMEAAQTNPQYFLTQLQQPVILDEIQYVPSLLRELKIIVDEQRQRDNHQAYGQWILTGSQQFELMNGVSDSLAGRIAIFHLETLSAAEIRQSTCIGYRLILSGREGTLNYPPWPISQSVLHLFFDGYVRTYIHRDLRQLIHDAGVKLPFHYELQLLASRVRATRSITENEPKQWG